MRSDHVLSTVNALECLGAGRVYEIFLPLLNKRVCSIPFLRFLASVIVDNGHSFLLPWGWHSGSVTEENSDHFPWWTKILLSTNLIQVTRLRISCPESCISRSSHYPMLKETLLLPPVFSINNTDITLSTLWWILCLDLSS